VSLFHHILSTGAVLKNCQFIEERLSEFGHMLPQGLYNYFNRVKIPPMTDEFTKAATEELEDYLDGSIFQNLDE
jgi:hypothetical protein